MAKRLLTFFPGAENFHLLKEVGMVPFIMYQNFGYDSTIACYKNGNYPALENEVKGLKVVFIRKIFKNQLLDSLWFLLWNAKKYDILQMFHWVMQNQICLFFFKLMKFGKCFTYLRLDADERIKNTKGVKLWIIEHVLPFINLVSIETKDLSSYFDNETKCKIEYMPNGFYDYGKRDIVEYENKQNIIITVGRIGATQKANEILLNGFRIFAKENKDWKLHIVGPIAFDFQNDIDKFFIENPELISRVIFFGPVYDKNKLFKLYKAAKVFALTSRWESFGIVYVEALQAGCYVLSTDITPAYDVTDNLKYGMVFPIDDFEALAICMKKVTTKEIYLKDSCSKSQQYVYENFYWPKILIKLDRLITETIF